MAVKISKKKDQRNPSRKATRKASIKRASSKKSLWDFYGALKEIYNEVDALNYQKHIRNEW